MPGGADLPYCKHLETQGGTDIIREYVQGGGSYLGLCAGAYFACGAVEFEVGHPTMEVCGPRQLHFFPGTGRGSVYPGFDYESERGAVAAPLRFRTSSSRVGGDDSDSGPWQTCKDSINGGPLFVLDSSATVVGINSRLPPGIEVLATYPERNHAAAAVACTVALGRAVLCSTHPELAPHWLETGSGGVRSDTVTGGVGTEVASDVAAVRRLCSALEEHREGRWAFWCELLVAAGLGDVLSAGRGGYKESL